ncbi:MAG: phospholipase [Planctomycetes bacterium]|nr:phospholipase [Planctomycetota bacterium]
MTDHLIRLSDADLRQVAAAIRASRLLAPYTSISLQRIVQDELAPAIATDLQELSDLGFGPNQIATTLELLAKDRDGRPELDESVDLVTTGPEAPGVTNRDTAVVVRDLFAQARESVLVAGYAVYQGQQVFKALADRMQENPDLIVQLFLDVQRPTGDSSEPNQLVRRFAQRFTSQQWPPDRPRPDVFYDPRSLDVATNKRACLHAKCVVVDEKTVFVSSANFTEAAQERNIELGLLIRSPALAQQIVWHFRALVSERILSPVF